MFIDDHEKSLPGESCSILINSALNFPLNNLNIGGLTLSKLAD